MSPTVISLVQRLPYVVDFHRNEIVWYPESVAINVLEEDGRVFSRDPSLSGDPECNPKYLNLDDLAIGYP